MNKLIPLSDRQCLECHDYHEEWDKSWQEPYFIMGVCFFCRAEMINDNKNKIDMEFKNLSFNDRFEIYGIKTIEECGVKYLIYKETKIIRPEFGTMQDIKRSINTKFNIDLDIMP